MSRKLNKGIPNVNDNSADRPLLKDPIINILVILQVWEQKHGEESWYTNATVLMTGYYRPQEGLTSERAN